MITETKQNRKSTERVHNFDNKSIEVNCNEEQIEHIFSFKLLGMWTDHINKTVKECFTTLPFKKVETIFNISCEKTAG